MEIKTIVDIYESYLEGFKNRPTFQYYDGKIWKYWTGETFKLTAKKLAAFLKDTGIEKGDKVLLISHNRPEWHLCDYAVLSIGAIVVPVYPTLSVKDTAYIASHSEAKCAIVSSPLMAEKLYYGLKFVGDLREVVVMEHSGSPRDELFYFSEAVAKGDEILRQKKDNQKIDVSPEDVASIIYTSGTTAQSKGVMLTHKNFVENAKASLARFKLHPEDNAIVFLPLAHSFERLANYAYMLEGLKISYAESIDRLAANMRYIKPTILCAVPRLFERVYSKLLDNAARSSYLKKVFIHWGVRTAKNWAKLKVLEKRKNLAISVIHVIFDLLFYRTLRGKMGGKLRFFVSGGAPLNPDIAAFFYGSGMKIAEGYGLTETAPVLTANNDVELYFGSVGKPLDNVQIRIAEDGEILAKGPNVMKGYFKNEEATKETFTEDGWLKTGDIGHFDEEGRLFITDRKKDLIVTAGGKNVAPQVIEAVLKENKYVNQVVVIGDQKPYLSVLIYPHWENVKAYAERKMIQFKNISELVKHHQIKHLFENVLKRANAKLSRFEQLKAVRLLENEMTIESGELTPTLKVKKRVVLQKYKELIDSMYVNSYGTQNRTKN